MDSQMASASLSSSSYSPPSPAKIPASPPNCSSKTACLSSPRVSPIGTPRPAPRPAPASSCGGGGGGREEGYRGREGSRDDDDDDDDDDDVDSRREDASRACCCPSAAPTGGGAGAPGPMSDRVVNPVAPRPRPATYPDGAARSPNVGAVFVRPAMARGDALT
eukprot:31275-Pelagococcus_subviridis.AAC.13